MSPLSACILTIVIETAFFACTKYRRTPLFLLLCVGVNGATNLAMNVSVEALSLPYWSFIPAELLVVAAEYALYRMFFNDSWRGKGREERYRLNRNLFLLTAFANLLSLTIGLLIAYL